MERLVLDELKKLCDSYLDQDAVEQGISFANNLREQKANLHTELSIYQRRVDEFATGIRSLYMDKVKGIISEADYVDMSQGFQVERVRLELQMKEVTSQIEQLDDRIKAGDNRRAIVERYVNQEHLTREAVEVLIDHVCVGKRIPGTRNVPIEIHWNF